MARAALSSAWIHVALVAVAAIAVGAGTIGHGFVFDDHLLLDGNGPVIRGEAPVSSVFTRRYWGGADEASPNELYRPVTILSLALNARILGEGPAGFHAVNIALHAANAILACLLFRALLARPIVSLLAALLFAVHPIGTEAVAPVSGRSDLLAASFLLAATLLVLVARRVSGARRAAALVGAGAITFLGALSKETAFVAPLVGAAALLAAGRPGDASAGDRRRLAWSAAGACALLLPLVAALVLRVDTLGYLLRSDPPSDPQAAYLAFVNNPIQFAPAPARILTSLRVAAMAAGLLVLPLHLSADYSFDQIPVSAGAPSAGDIASAIFGFATLAAIPLLARRAPGAAFAIAWMALTYLPASNLLFPTGTIFGERLLYVPLAGFALLVALAIAAVGASPRRKTAVAVISLGLMALLGARFVARANDWSSDGTLFASAVAASPRSAKAHSNYGFTLQQDGRFEEASGAYRRALEIAPKLTGARVGLARCLVQLGSPGEAVALLEKERESGTDLRQLAPDLAGAHYALGVRRLAEGKREVFLEEMRAAVGYVPDHGPARFNLSLDALERGDLGAAREEAKAALRSGYVFPAGFLAKVGLEGEAR
jgi:tetratricopeptide (TPR) repeat protein